MGNNISGKSVLVTGGAGFIGSHLVDALAEAGVGRLAVVDNLFLGRRENLEVAERRMGSLRFYDQDASDPTAMRRIVTENEVEVVFDLAVIPLPTSLEHPKWSVDQNVLMTTTLCELARDRVYRTLIHFSSSEAYGTAQNVPMSEAHPLVPLTPYAASKAAGDHIVLSYVEAFNIDAAILRPFNNYGPRQNDQAYAGVLPIVITNVLHEEPVTIFGDGEQTRDFIFVKDTADATLAAYECSDTRGHTVNIASGRQTSINELVRTILKVMNAEDHPVVHGPPRPADVRCHCGDIARVRELFGFSPKTALDDGLKRTVDWYLRRRS
jgi:UDP-glucose 4-epimerase